MYEIRFLKMSDKDSLIKLDDESGLSLSEWIDDDDSEYVWGILEGTELIGCLSMGGVDGFEYAEEFDLCQPEDLILSDVYIKKTFRGSGLSQKMIEHVLGFYESSVSNIFLTIIDSGLSYLYSKCGFKLLDEDYLMVYKTGNR